MTTPAIPATTGIGSAPTKLLEKLLGAVRPEFRGDALIPGVGDAILGNPACVVPGCGRVCRYDGMCTGHVQRWNQLGRPELAVFITQTNPHMVGRGALESCVVDRCRYGRSARGLCTNHNWAWRRDGRPDRERWIAAAVVGDGEPPDCAVPGCQLWAGRRSGFCSSHQSRWTSWSARTGSDDLGAFVHYCDTRGDARIDFSLLPPQLKLELQYATQCRVDERRGKVKPYDVQLVVRLVAASGARSLLERPAESWDAEFLAFTPRAHGNANAIPLGFLRAARRKVDDLAHGLGWDAEYGRDVWDLQRVGIHAKARHVRFDGIPQPWLRELVKRWARWRLTTDISPVHISRSVTHLTRFAEFLADTSAPQALSELTRDAIERFVAHIAQRGDSIRSRRLSLGSIGRFVLAIRQHRWDPTLPAEVVIHPEDYPRLAEAPPPGTS